MGLNMGGRREERERHPRAARQHSRGILPGLARRTFELQSLVAPDSAPRLEHLLREIDLRETAVSEAARATLVREHGLRIMSAP
ncbi:hypothetical protein D7W82_02080 [Corallococcus sp. CA049B]|nr:hypothetical protein D7W82_02080 [Corallococcus sp. CA049B]